MKVPPTLERNKYSFGRPYEIISKAACYQPVLVHFHLAIIDQAQEPSLCLVSNWNELIY
jgi:hypothetical protein